MVAYAFNAAQHQPQYGVAGGLPVGPNGEPQKYKVIISDTEAKPTASGDGGYIQLSLKCLEGPFKDVIQFDNLNLHNKSAQAVEIANKQLSAYCHVTGKFMIADTQELCNIPFWIEIRKQKKNPEYTEVSAIFDINGNEPGKAGSGPAPVITPPSAQPPAVITPPSAQPPAVITPPSAQPPAVQPAPTAPATGTWPPTAAPGPAETAPAQTWPVAPAAQPAPAGGGAQPNPWA